MNRVVFENIAVAVEDSRKTKSPRVLSFRNLRHAPDTPKKGRNIHNLFAWLLSHRRHRRHRRKHCMDGLLFRQLRSAWRRSADGSPLGRRLVYPALTCDGRKTGAAGNQ